MRRKLFCNLFFLTMVMAFAPLSFAEDQTVFGPIDCKTSKWHVHFSSYTFHVAGPGDGVIIVSKIRPAERIGHALLLLNRRPIPLPGIKRKDKIVIPIKGLLRTRNHLKVFLAGQPKASVRITIKQTTTCPVPPPQVSLVADPQSIPQGGTAILSWVTTNADSVTLDQGIGQVVPNGSIAVSPSQATTYTLTATNAGGTSSAESTVSFVNGQVVPLTLTVDILSPIQGQQFTSDVITVSGTVNRPNASVFVNGIEAVVSGNAFTAEQIPLLPSANTISVLAEDGVDTAVASVTVVLDMAVDLQPIHLDIDSVSDNESSLKTAGQATVTIINDDGGSVSIPYHVVLFEDTDRSGGYEAAADNWLGETIVASGPGAGESMDVAIDFSGQLQFRDNRLHVCVDSTDAVQESNENNNIMAANASGTDLSASLLVVDDAACPDEITLAVRIGNAGDASVPAGVPVAFYNGEPGNGGTLIGVPVTPQALEPGQYLDLTLDWSNPPTGTRLVYVQTDDDGTGAGTLQETNEENNRVFSPMTICAAPVAQPNGISGQVIDAVTGDFLSAAMVSLHQAENSAAGALIVQTITDQYGGYRFSNLDPGDYLLVAELAGYVTMQQPVALAVDQALAHQALVLSPALNAGERRIILTWGAQPADLESHLTAPNPEGCRHHCYHWDKTIPGASLDVDSMDAYGPETITMDQLQSGTYRFYVHDYTNRLSGSSTTLSTSGATVTVYSGDGDVPQVFSVPAGAGNVWHVFNLDGASGTITPIHKMAYQGQPGSIDFPRITSSPVTHATYKETYVYQIAAEDPDLDTLTYSLVNGPEGMQLDPFTGVIQWTPTAGQGQWQDVEIRVDDGRCGEDTQSFRIFLTYLPTVEFAVTPCAGINPGGEITLAWQTQRAETVVIDQGIGEVETSGSLSIPSPDQPSAYTLTAVNGAGQTQRTVPSTIGIRSLTADCVSDTGETTLTWETKCAASCWIDQGIGGVPVNGSIVVAPLELPTDYTLTCSNATQTTSRPLTVNRCGATAQINAAVSCCWSAGDPVTLNWTASEVGACSIAPDVGSVPSSGSMDVFPDSLSVQYTLTCDSAAASVYVGNPTSARLAASATALLPGESTTLYWDTNCFDACSLDQGIGDVPTQGSVAVTPAQLPLTYTLTATCDQLVHTEEITIRQRAPEVTFGASPALIKTGEAAILTWSTERATSCSIHPDIGAVDLNGSITVAPDENTIYTLTAIGPGGTTTRNATVTYVQPTAAIYADPVALDTVGQTSTLTWVFSNADTCVIDQGIGEIQLGGSLVVSPIQTTTYTISATGPGGTATNSVTVAFPSPTVTFSADRDTLDEGQTATLTWASGNVDTCFIDQGIGDVQPNGSLVVDPDRTTTYTITARGPGGTVTGQLTLTCLAPTASIQADPATIIEGQSSTVSWQTDHAATVSITPYPGQVDAEGTSAVSPSLTKTYSLTASGRGGTATAKATLTVINPPSIGLIEPDGIDDNTNASYTIRWTDRDPDSDAVISLYYDLNDSGADGNLIIDGLDETPDGLADQTVWDTRGILAGDYYVYAVIDDGVNAPVVAYSIGPITIGHAVTGEIKLTAGDGAAYDSFGSAVSIDGDYAVVGAPYRSAGGMAYIFKNQGTTWSEQAVLISGDNADYFGLSASISGDTAMVGAPKGNENRGAAYVFRHDGENWTQEARLIADDGAQGDTFGQWLCTSGDTLVVGAPGQNHDTGAAYVFERDGTTWGSPSKLTADSSDGAGRFGASVAIHGDVLIVGAPSADNGAGTAYIYRRSETGWVEESRLTASDARDWSRFGNTVSIIDNYAIVGNVGMAEAMIEGTAYIFMHDGSAWIEQTKIGASDVDAGESFARDVAINGNVAAIGEPAIWDSAGAVYLFTRTGDGWFAQETTKLGEGEIGEGEGEGGGLPEASTTSAAFQRLTPSDGQANDHFGTAVAMDAEHVIVGTVFDDDKGYDSGSAYVYPLFSVSIDADPSSIQLGGEGASTTLSWSSLGADSVSIDQGIGPVDPSGSIAVAPFQTTTYTITGTRSEAKVTASVTVTVIDSTAAPMVTISAVPETIIRGESTTLSWSATNVETAILDNEIGTVPMTGSLTVSPQETMTYTVTAANEQGTRSAGVTVTVTDPVPIVNLSAEPAQIMAGESATLVWSTAYADMISIDPGVGAVDISGTLAVTPNQTTTYTITAKGPGGTAIRSSTVMVISPISIQIISPANRASIDLPNTMVRGTFVNTTGSETGITVNGRPAMVSGDTFIINNISLEEGLNAITVKATDSDGYSQTAVVTVNVTLPKQYINISSNIDSGNSPLELTLTIDGSFSIDNSALSYTGISPAKLTRIEPDAYQVSLMDTGIIYFTAQVVHEGMTYTDTIAILVVDAAEIDALLQQKWEDMKAKLAGGNIEGALDYFSEDTRPMFDYNLTLLHDHMDEIITCMQSISLVKIEENQAQYNLVGQQGGQSFSFYLLFAKSADGIWRIVNF